MPRPKALRRDSPREQRRLEDLARRRSDVLAAASSVIAAKGFHEAQMAEIAASAEVSLATLYAMFAGKDRIFEEIVTSAATAIREDVRAKVLPIADPRERLLVLVDALCACFDANRDLLLIYATGTQALPWRTRQLMGARIGDLYHNFIDWVAGIARDARLGGLLADVEPDVFAASLVGAVTATASRWFELQPQRALGEAAASLRALFACVLAGKSR
jgi:AcrR family transcriptional regulator